MDKQQLLDIIDEAKRAAKAAANEHLNKYGDFDACGFAFVNIYKLNDKKIDGRTKVGRLLSEVGIDRSWTRTYQVWNPAEMCVQSVGILTAGADAYAEVLRKYGFEAYSGSRLD